MRMSFSTNSILQQLSLSVALIAALIAGCGDEPAASGRDALEIRRMGRMDSLLDLARNLRESGELDASWRKYREFLRVNGTDDADVALEAAEVLMELREFEAAIHTLRSISGDNAGDAGDPVRAKCLRIEARALHAVGRHADAESALRRAMKIDPGHAVRGDLFGRILLAQGKHLEAVRELESQLNRQRVSRIEGGRSALYYHLGRAYRALGKGLLAKEAFSHHRRLQAESERLGRLERAVQNRPESPDALLDLALAQCGADRWTRATHSLREALRISGMRADLEAILAAVLVRGERTEEGVTLARLSLSKGEHPMANYALALSAQRRGDSKSAKQEISLTVRRIEAAPECFHDEILDLARQLKAGE